MVFVNYYYFDCNTSSSSNNNGTSAHYIACNSSSSIIPIASKKSSSNSTTSNHRLHSALLRALVVSSSSSSSSWYCWWKQTLLLLIIINTISNKNQSIIGCSCTYNYFVSSLSLLHNHNMMLQTHHLRSSQRSLCKFCIVPASATATTTTTSLFLHNAHCRKVLQFRTTSSSSSSKGNNKNNNNGSSTSTSTSTKRKDSWRKQIHVSDDVPLAWSNSELSSTTASIKKVENKKLQFQDTPLGKNGIHLLDGLDHYTVYANDDGHPLSVYGIQSEHLSSTTPTTTTSPNNNPQLHGGTTRKPILLLHGRTWSSVPVYHLLGGPFAAAALQNENKQEESRSLMEALYHKGLQPYCMDFRGFGGTHKDMSNSNNNNKTTTTTQQTQCATVEPYRCVQDAESVLQWIQQRHSNATTTCVENTNNINNNNNHENDNNNNNSNSNNNNNNSHNLCNDETAIPALLGWSQGALVAQLVAQRNFHHHHHHTNTIASAMPLSSVSSSVSVPKPLISKLILYGSIYDPLVRYPREPLYVSSNPSSSSSSKNKDATIQQPIYNTYDAAIEDFTVEGTIPPEPARLFAEAALLSDPIKVIWKNLHQFNNCDPARVYVPCLVIAGDQDPYAPLHVQQELFCNLARASDRTWSILSGSDHACHLLDGRDRLINTVVSFVMNGKRTEPRF